MSCGAKTIKLIQTGVAMITIKLNDLFNMAFNESTSLLKKSLDILGIKTVAEEIIKGIEILVSLMDAE